MSSRLQHALDALKSTPVDLSDLQAADDRLQAKEDRRVKLHNPGQANNDKARQRGSRAGANKQRAMYAQQAARFAAIWNRCRDAEHAVETLGGNRGAILQRARRLRKQGIELKEFPLKKWAKFDTSKYTHPVCSSVVCSRETDGKHKTCDRCRKLTRDHMRRYRQAKEQP